MHPALKERVIDQLNTLTPFRTIVEFTDIITDINMGHTLTFEGIDSDGLRTKEAVWVDCDNDECPTSNNENLPVIPKEFIATIEEVRNDRVSVHRISVINELKKMLPKLKEDPSRLVNKLFDYTTSNGDEYAWRKFFVTEVVNPIYPFKLRGFTVDNDGELNSIEIYSTELGDVIYTPTEEDLK